MKDCKWSVESFILCVATSKVCLQGPYFLSITNESSVGTLVVEKGTKTLLLRTIEEEQKGLKLNSRRNIIGQNRNIHG